MAPEQIHGHTVPASDQYALGIVVYEWLTGVVPFTGSYMEIVSQQVAAPPLSLRAKVPAIAPAVEQVVLIALAKEPQKRFGRVEVFAHALEQAAQPRFEPSISLSQPSGAASLPKSVSEVPAMAASLTGPLGRTVLGPTRLTIGRAADNQLVVTDPKASSHHA
jgi:serine/threonine protein kinase